MRDIINNPEFKKYLETYPAGKALFLEGDDSKDLYFLVSGNLKLLKNKKQIGEIFKAGEMIGEMSYLIDSKRTASIIAHTDACLLRIPEDNVAEFIKQNPEVSHRIIETLAQRLKDTTQVAHGLKEFCDQLPDAVVMTDTNNKIMAWNKAAENLHGRVWQEMKGQSISDVFQNPEEYKQFIDDVQAGRHLQEKILLIKHPDGADCYVSTSTTVIYDGHFNIAGYIFLSRNVTKMKQLEDKYKSVKKIFIPVFLTIAILLGLIIAGMSTFSKGVKILDHRKTSFQSRIIHDYKTLQASEIITKNGSIDKKLADYFKNNHPGEFAIRGILVLDNEKKVINAYSLEPGNNQSLIGSNYSGVKFSCAGGVCLLNIYRIDEQHPMGARCSELAFQIKDRTSSGWLVFQLDMGYLKREFGIDKKILAGISFE